MKLRRLVVENFKSIKHADFSPRADFCAFIGPNASGKSNFASAIDFLSSVYGEGLETAVAKKGGYENISHRKQRRTKSGLYFLLHVELSREDSKRFAARIGARPIEAVTSIEFEHEFTFKASDQAIKADFNVAYESIKLWANYQRGDMPKGLFPIETTALEERSLVGEVARHENKITVSEKSTDWVKRQVEFFNEFHKDIGGAEQSLLASDVLFTLAFELGQMAVYQLSPRGCRGPGVPSPSPRMSFYGENLPAIVDWLQRRHKREWNAVLRAMREIIPTLKEISVSYLHTKTLGLFFQEEGYGRPWIAEDVSDGTIQALAVLTTLVDPRNSLVFVEEPENSVHPWIVRVLLKYIRDISEEKPVFITTHSPVVINQLSPPEIWVVSREHGETSVRNLLDIDPSISESWETGKVRLFELLDTGTVKEAIPPSE